MNTLNLIKTRMAKKKALSQAQLLMAKAYRGVEYTDAHRGNVQEVDSRVLLYRGTRYMSMK